MAEIYKIKKYIQNFEDFNFDEEFDVIVNMHVIEHVVDPVLHLKKVKAALKKDGVLFLGTPNLDSWSRVFAGRKWQGYTPALIYKRKYEETIGT